MADLRTITTRDHLLLPGIIVGPAFVLVAAVQVLVRDGFDLDVHPLSALSLGRGGWVQILNFVVGGALVVTTAVDLRRLLRGTPAGAFGPLFLGLFGAGLILSGLFTADPAYGFPPGAPDGLPQMSWHGFIHMIAAQVSFASMGVAILVFARRFFLRRELVMAIYSLLTPLAVVAAVVAPGDVGFSARLFVGTVVLFAWLTVACVHFSRERGRHA